MLTLAVLLLVTFPACLLTAAVLSLTTVTRVLLRPFPRRHPASSPSNLRLTSFAARPGGRFSLRVEWDAPPARAFELFVTHLLPHAPLPASPPASSAPLTLSSERFCDVLVDGAARVAVFVRSKGSPAAGPLEVDFVLPRLLQVARSSASASSTAEALLSVPKHVNPRDDVGAAGWAVVEDALAHPDASVREAAAAAAGALVRCRSFTPRSRPRAVSLLCGAANQHTASHAAAVASIVQCGGGAAVVQAGGHRLLTSDSSTAAVRALVRLVAEHSAEMGDDDRAAALAALNHAAVFGDADARRAVSEGGEAERLARRAF